MRYLEFVIAATLGVVGVSQAEETLAGKKQSDSDKPLYTVVDGYKVDADTLTGFRTWRAAACDRCHGANQEGMVGPSLIESLKVISKEDFIAVVRDGQLEKGMPSFGGDPRMMENIEHLYSYLKGRSDGAITRARVQAMD
jgi:mono/diheme cytochrome c family protein